MERQPAAPASGVRGGPAAAWTALAILSLIAAVYGQVRGFAFVNLDDPMYVSENPVVLGGLSWTSLRWAFDGFHAFNWHPLTWLSHLLDVSLFGADPGWHHLSGVALHAANAALLLTLLVRMTGAFWRSAAVATLFAVHPLNVESVAWIAERKTVLSAAFFLLALHAWVSFVRRPGAARYLAVAGLAAASLLSKPTAVTLPCVLLLVDAWPLGRLGEPGAGRGARVAALVREKLPLFALTAAASATTWLAQSGAEAAATLGAVPIVARVENALVSYVLYVWRAVWPAGLAAFYPHPVLGPGGIPAWQVVGAIAAVAGVSALALRERTRRPWLLWGWLWYVGTLVPVIGLVQVGLQGSADRYAYLPLVGVLVPAVWGAAELLERVRAPRGAAAAAAAIPALILAAVAFRQVATWRDSLTLHARAIAVTDGNFIAWNGLGDGLAAAGRVEESIRARREALAIRPEFPEAWHGIGAAYGAQGAHAQAIPFLERAVQLRPGYAEAWYNLGTAYGNLGDHARAARCFRSAVRSRPDDARAWHSLGIASVLSGDAGGAAESLQVLRRVDPARALALGALIDAGPRR